MVSLAILGLALAAAPSIAAPNIKPTASPTPDPALTSTPNPTATATPTPTATVTPTATPASTPTGTATATASPTPAAAAAATLRTFTLEEAYQELDAQNLTLAQARSRAEEARAVVRQAWSPLLPTLSASGGYTRNRDEAKVSRPGLPGQPVPAPLFIQPLEAFSAAGTLHIPLLVPASWFEVGAARQAAAAASASSEATRLQIRSALAQSAWLAAQGEEIVAASERAVETARDQERSARRAVAAGTAAPLSTLQAQTDTTRRESDLVRARSELDRARLALGAFLGRAEPVRIALGPAQPPDTLDTETLAAEALSRRPEIRAQEALLISAERQLDSARWRLAPQLSASGSAFASDVPFPTGQKEGWRATVDLSFTLYDGGLRYGKARQAEAALAGAEAARGEQRLEVVQQVKDAARDVAVARERLRLAERQRELAAEAAATAKRSFQAGVAGSVDVLDANEKLYQAEVGLADARARLGVAAVSLDRAVGRAP